MQYMLIILFHLPNSPKFILHIPTHPTPCHFILLKQNKTIHYKIQDKIQIAEMGYIFLSFWPPTPSHLISGLL